MSKIDKRKAIALFSYTAAYEDELSFNQGDVLLVTEMTSIEEGWYQAEKDGKAGIVPGNYLEFINDNPASGDGNQDRSTTDSTVQTAPPQAPYRVCGMNVDSCVIA
mmetsp:Transcript_25920/g.40460  ORF Transcript_25920/g.40460 Transcript_25920/m.40460 type:complete len:106 (-) Transcript_25920:253-570(-)|eukprot:CAMPEP_0201506500 /NCGR_PEP_ID=MMETSP0161_2-20130828/437_1 /ASSEMBLY_ACC=CAM_ASM_000251 /TAXON_ID=180227 /ORGANISM="Neoparamoeba aestuarina, Strain SoJaBio B1-5/56/2" /LENGTH=105 /DNA_ID=CAMNT_0047900607 /DNA_START=89 /DNA_END=406 /DNA_ORIENTATION=-